MSDGTCDNRALCSAHARMIGRGLVHQQAGGSGGGWCVHRHALLQSSTVQEVIKRVFKKGCLRDAMHISILGLGWRLRRW